MPPICNPTVELDGAAVRRIRETKRLTQLYVAKVVGVTTDTISRWENNRYPSIKRENLLGLAQALEVSPETLIHGTDADAEISPAPASLHPSLLRRNHWLLWSGIIFFLFLFVFYYFFQEPAITFVPEINAWRILPTYAAPGAVVPVRITLAVDASTGGFIVREHFPVGWKLIEASPPASSLDNVEGMARWIVKAGDVPPVISYLIRVNSVATSGNKGIFKGDVVLRQNKNNTPAVINGDDEAYIQPYHWADDDGNSVIDDREVLEAFDAVEAMKDVHLDWDGLSALWDDGTYRWDQKKGKFVSTRSTSQ
ncbi:MAG: helix-turn-helix transcriptional regulator [Desulfuromonadales bacterium]|nr:helix-turn-helix transcriptional regulator [Desulfuromonadales bacterium]